MVSTSDSVNSKKILVVDDTALSRMSTVLMLEESGFTVVEAESGPAALKLLKSDDFALVLMDFQMPDMNGIECTELIRHSHDGLNPHIPIVALTSGGEDNLEARCMAAGMNAYLLKSLSADEMMKVIGRFV